MLDCNWQAGKTKLYIFYLGVCKVWFFISEQQMHTEAAFCCESFRKHIGTEWHMNIQKVINNNVISAFDEKKQEIVIMGRGIGFKAHIGDVVDESRIEKVFRIENENLSRQFQEILQNIPLEHMQLSKDIIAYAK